MHKRLKAIQCCLIGAVEAQLNHPEEVCTEELGEVIDMIKDISETIYYYTITEAMEDKEMMEEHHHKVETKEPPTVAHHML